MTTITKMIKLKNYSLGEGTDKVRIVMKPYELIYEKTYNPSEDLSRQISEQSGKAFRAADLSSSNFAIKPDSVEISIEKKEEKKIRIDLEMSSEKTPIKIIAIKAEVFNVKENPSVYWEIFDFRKDFIEMKNHMETAFKELEKIKEFCDMVNKATSQSISDDEKKKVMKFLSNLIQRPDNEIKELELMLYKNIDYEGMIETYKNQIKTQEVQLLDSAKNSLKKVLETSLKNAEQELRDKPMAIGSITEGDVSVDLEDLSKYLKAFSKTEIYYYFKAISGLIKFIELDRNRLGNFIHLLDFIEQDQKKETEKHDQEFQKMIDLEKQAIALAEAKNKEVTS